MGKLYNGLYISDTTKGDSSPLTYKINKTIPTTINGANVVYTDNGIKYIAGIGGGTVAYVFTSENKIVIHGDLGVKFELKNYSKMFTKPFTYNGKKVKAIHERTNTISGLKLVVSNTADGKLNIGDGASNIVTFNVPNDGTRTPQTQKVLFHHGVVEVYIDVQAYGVNNFYVFGFEFRTPYKQYITNPQQFGWGGTKTFEVGDYLAYKTLTLSADTRAKTYEAENKIGATIILDSITYKDKQYEVRVWMFGKYFVLVNDDDGVGATNMIPNGVNFTNEKDNNMPYSVNGFIWLRSRLEEYENFVQVSVTSTSATQAEINEVKSKFKVDFTYTSAYTSQNEKTAPQWWARMALQIDTEKLPADKRQSSHQVLPLFDAPKDYQRNLWYGDVETKINVGNGIAKMWCYINNGSGEQGAVGGASNIKVTYTP